MNDNEWPDLTLKSENSLKLEDKIPHDQVWSFSPRCESLMNPSLNYFEYTEKKDSIINSPQRKKNYIYSKRNTQQNGFTNRIRNSKKFVKEEKPKEKTQIINPFQLSKCVKMTSDKLLSIVRNKKFFNSVENYSDYHYKIVNDSCAYQEEKVEQKSNYFYNSKSAVNLKDSISLPSAYFRPLIMNCIKNLDYFMKRLPKFDPNHFMKLFWDLFVVSILIIELLLYSLEIGFNINNIEHNDINFFSLIHMLTLFADVFLSLNTIYYKDGLQIKDSTQIMYNYLITKMWSDILACIASSFNFFLNSKINWLDFDPLTLFKLLKYGEFEKRMKNIFINSKRTEALYKILILIMKILLAAHLLACFWHLLGHSINEKNPSGSNWLKAAGIENEPWNVRYLFSIYWGITTMLTVGYGDITPTNQEEIFFNIWAMLIDVLFSVIA